MKFKIEMPLGSWLKNPYIAFGISAVAELAGLSLVHLLLDRLGRKKTYCLFVMSLTVVSIFVIPIQMLLPKDSEGND